MNKKISDFIVKDRKDFIKFIELLREDFISNPDNWENRSLEDFFEALAAYANDIQGYYANMKQDVDADKPSWQTFADIFKGATVYE